MISYGSVRVLYRNTAACSGATHIVASTEPHQASIAINRLAHSQHDEVGQELNQHEGTCTWVSIDGIGVGSIMAAEQRAQASIQ